MVFIKKFKKSEEFEKIKSFINNKNAKKIALQLPEGLKTQSREIIDSITDLDCDVLLFADPCFGACDIPEDSAKQLNCDVIIHFAHSKYLKNIKIPILYVEYRTDNNKEIIETLTKNISKLKEYSSIGLITTLQHINSLDNVKEILEKNNIKTYIGKPKLATYKGQILGCDQSSAKDITEKVECFLYIGSGLFHPLGVARDQDKPVWILDIEKKELNHLKKEYEKYYTKIILKKAKFDIAQNIGLLVSTKNGQMDKNIKPIKTKLEALGKKVYVLVMNHISYDKMEGIGIDFLINTACPRLEEDLTFDRPLLNWNTLKQYL
ncbi:MAG: diphthamide biosynthesis enzyme Dph2 [DPANN group archaeon]|nr:diphthamide biosynthesis enzyme Dph2 [DPANN group archaeon]